jgi:hypothetical protein
MSENLISRKYALIQEIMSLESDALELLEAQVATVKAKETFWKAAKPMRKNLTLEMIMKEQNYKPVSREVFFQMAADVQVEEPLEELLEMLTR